MPLHRVRRVARSWAVPAPNKRIPLRLQVSPDGVEGSVMLQQDARLSAAPGDGSKRIEPSLDARHAT